MATDNCVKHQFDPAEAMCRNCAYRFCAGCLVYPFGAHQPPYCIACAVAASGVRRSAANRPLFGRRELRRRAKLDRRA
ncbi:hypothetical protein BH20ACT2_BH20ACT2_25560 [soil metagenome]